MREHLAEHAGWVPCIHVSTFLFLLGITVLTRALGKGIESPPARLARRRGIRPTIERRFHRRASALQFKDSNREVVGL